MAIPENTVNLDMLTFNMKGPSKNDERLRKLHEEKQNELLAYQNEGDSVATGMHNGEKVFAETSKE